MSFFSSQEQMYSKAIDFVFLECVTHCCVDFPLNHHWVSDEKKSSSAMEKTLFDISRLLCIECGPAYVCVCVFASDSCI